MFYRDSLTRFCGMLFVSFYRSEVSTHKERVHLFLKFRFRVEFFDFRSCAHSLMCMDSVTRFSTSGFFHQSTPPRALTHRLRPFRIWFRIRRNNRHYSSFRDAMDTTEIVSAVSMTPLKPP
jgi:hypothetical protein